MSNSNETTERNVGDVENPRNAPLSPVVVVLRGHPMASYQPGPLRNKTLRIWGLVFMPLLVICGLVFVFSRSY